MKILILVTILSISLAVYAEKCCPETDLGLLCETSSTKTKPKCKDDQRCCIRIDNAFECCNTATQYCNVTAGGCRPTPSKPLTRITIGTFGDNLVTTMARKLDLWAKEGLDVVFVRVPSSTAQFQWVRDNTVDFISSAADNIVNYNLNSNNPVGNQLITTKVFLAADRGLNQGIAAQPNYTTLAQLKGKVIGVDSAVSGFAYVVYKLLREAGLEKDVDYTVIEVGGGGARVAALRAGTIQAAILSGENLLQATLGDGKVILATAGDVLGSYISSVFAAKPAYLAANRTIIRAFTRAYLLALKYVLDPANAQTIINVLAASNSSISPSQFYSMSVNTQVGLSPDGIIDQEGWYYVIGLRNEFNGFQNPQSDKQLCDLSQEKSGLFTLDYVAEAYKSLGYKWKDPKVDKKCKNLGLIVDDSADASSLFTLTSLILVIVAMLINFTI